MAKMRVIVRLACGHNASFGEDMEAAQDAVANGSHILCTPCQERFSPFFKAVSVESHPEP